MEAASILRELIAIPSVNPMGRPADGPEFFEGRTTAYLRQFFTALNVEWQEIEVVPGRSNVIARYDAPNSGQTVLLDAHQDTVPVDGMTIEPFHPVVRDGKMYGRGACDVKGGMAAMLAAFARIVRERPSTSCSVVMSCTCDEESTVLGVSDLVKLWTDPERSSSLLPGPPDVAIVAEPTDLDVVVAHRGATRWKIRTKGRACHSSRPSDGINAIYRMARVVTCLEEFAEKLPTMVPAHPLCGPATLSVGLIQGGISVNTVPDECTIEIDRRVIPGEEGRDVIADVAEFLRPRLEFEPEMLPPWITAAALSDAVNGDLADRLLKQVNAVAGTHRKVGVMYGTHASRISAAGVPSVVFGPGSIAQAHTKDEWISLAELEQASEVYFRFCAAAP
ncbi:MAG: M20 family metallopeptidase [Planctomycetaceae bacterium]